MTDAGILGDDIQRFQRIATAVKLVSKSSSDDEIEKLSDQLESCLIDISSYMRRVVSSIFSFLNDCSFILNAWQVYVFRQIFQVGTEILTRLFCLFIAAERKQNFATTATRFKRLERATRRNNTIVLGSGRQGKRRERQNQRLSRG